MAKGPYEVINPSNKLKDLVGGTTRINDNLLAKAEQAAQDFVDTIDLSETTKPQLAALQVSVDAIEGGTDQAEHEKKIYAIMHDLRGEGANFGYPLVTRIATSMNHYFESGAAGARGRNDPDVISAHAGALRAVLANKLKGEAGVIGDKIAEGLEAITEVKV
jgi:hypothetical protein